jgi:5-hydroxyisourate hydrolase
MPGISIHVVDVSRGVVAVGMSVAVFQVNAAGGRQVIGKGLIGANGTLGIAALGCTQAVGTYEVDFGVAEYYRAQAIDLNQTPFLGVVTYRFGLADPAAHIHLPLKCTPWGYSCFRGGA